MVGMIGISHQICQKNNLNKIHLSGLSTIGIPKKLKGLTHPFFIMISNHLNH